MRITRLILENYIGILAGLKRSRIELDFSSNTRRSILLLGKNGSGKSTILSALHPFSDSFDERSNLIVAGKEGYKEIHLVNEEDEYVIKHYYGKKHRSFISKNGEELNASGGVRTFNDTVKNELNVTPDHFKLIKIGSSTSNFIDLTSTTRKSYIGKFTPDIEQYLNYYKVVNEKFNDTTKSIRYITDEISKLPKADEIDDTIKILSKTLRVNKNSLLKEVSNVATLQYELDLLTEKLKDLVDIKDIETIRTRIEKTKLKLNTSIESLKGKLFDLKNSINKFIDSYYTISIDNGNVEIASKSNRLISDDLLSTLNKVLDEIEVIQQNISNTSIDVSTLSTLIEKLFHFLNESKNEHNNNTYQLNSLKIKLAEDKSNYANLNTVDISKVLEQIEGTNKKIEFHNFKIDELIAKLFPEFKITHKNDQGNVFVLSKGSTTITLTEEVLNTFKDEISTISNNLSTYIEKYNDLTLSSEDKASIAEYLECDFNSIFENYDFRDGGNLSSELDKLTEIIDGLESKEQELSLRQKSLNIKIIEQNATKSITGMCSSPKCPVYQIKLQQSSLESEYEEVSKELKSIQDEIEHYNSLLNDLTVLNKFYLMFIRFINTILNKQVYSLLDIIEGNKPITFLLDYNFSVEMPYKLDNLLTLIKRLLAVSAQYTIVNNSTALIEQHSNIREYAEKLRASIDSLQNEIYSLDSNLNEFNHYLYKFSNIYDSLRECRDDILTLTSTYSKCIDDEKELVKITEIFDANRADIERKDELTLEISKINSTISSLQESIEEIEADLNSNNLKKMRLDEFKTRHDTLISERSIYQVLREALDVKTGIPLYIIGTYLTAIKTNTNKLLKLAFNQNIEIDFNITDSEFTIPVYRDGVLFNEDVKTTSQGETALLKTCISLGILIQVLKQDDTKFNVVYCDEIDAELDSDKRYIFIDILNQQLDAINCEQAFIISHNEAFQASEVGLLLLPGSTVDITNEDFMFNKTLICDLRN